APLFQALTSGSPTPWRDREARLAQRGGEPQARPVAIIIPGIVGSHLEIDRQQPTLAGSGRRIWFDLPSLRNGKLALLGDPDATDVAVADLLEILYGDLADYLASTHTVIRCPYDWRRAPEFAADALRDCVELAAREHPGQPIRLVAHGLGGLVARVLMRRHADSWRRVVASGGRLLMLGTPNRGSHHLVHTLLGKADSLRMLARIDTEHDLQQLLDVVGGFPGALALLPRPGFDESGGGGNSGCVAAREYYASATWKELKASNRDRWYGDGVKGFGAEPTQERLNESEAWWTKILPTNTVTDPERISCVFGQGEKTPCGVLRTPDGRLQLLFTADGDGSVTWASGFLDNVDVDTRYWYLPVEHGELTTTAEYSRPSSNCWKKALARDWSACRAVAVRGSRPISFSKQRRRCSPARKNWRAR
ncbi:MAG: hypothetical protein ABI478_09385, partial [Propionivibrio sp.]